MTLQQTVAESLEQLKAWIAFLEDERRRLQDEIRRIRENAEAEARGEPETLSAPIPPVDAPQGRSSLGRPLPPETLGPHGRRSASR